MNQSNLDVHTAQIWWSEAVYILTAEKKWLEATFLIWISSNQWCLPFSYVKQVTNQIVRGDMRGGEEKRIADEYKAKEEKKKVAEQKMLL